MSLTVVFRETALRNLARIRGADKDLFTLTRRARGQRSVIKQARAAAVPRRYPGATGSTAAAGTLTGKGNTMATTSPWPLMHAEREALIDELGTLTGGQWATASLCANCSAALLDPSGEGLATLGSRG